MNEKTNDQERAVYNQLIIQKENQMDRLLDDQKEIEKSLYQLDEDFQRGFQQLRCLNENNNGLDKVKYFRAQQWDDDLESRLRCQVQDAQEEFNYVFQKEIHEMDDEREKLYKKRSEIPWD
ncbi:TPA: hypothetical protein IQB69_000666 [Listeria monocytogenes]|uniref:hypothetical protein n=1 Tax=Listeria monocytogenes TaxID=1639 RepID=UPI000A17AABD|nr:hypothetical protein [Listeria monocytogenes]EHC6225904.1 hypothetical protein [Listeria monocytogenes serotype 1/2a]MBF2347756.1 hypothetical protein [Listeria marthii]ARJ91437.1 hypothetical protein ABY78_02090 [Listeria monocytogenes]EAC8475487.1 hypothetical protein [Listeria monocytogenes]EAD2921755.1 hypothetical protein [Listeria monocytogenes]